MPGSGAVLPNCRGLRRQERLRPGVARVFRGSGRCHSRRHRHERPRPARSARPHREVRSIAEGTMAIDFEMTPPQRKLKEDAREFAREVLRPLSERADAIADPQQAFVAMKPAFEAATALGFATSFLPAKYGGGGASIVDTIIVTEELSAVDGGFPTILLVNGLGLMPLAWYGTEQQAAKWIGRAV